MDLLKLSIFTLFLAASIEACQHVIVAPKGLRTDTDTNVFIDFHNCPATVNLVATLSSLPDKRHEHSRFEEEYEHRGESKAIHVRVNSQKREEDKRGKIVDTASLLIAYCFPPNCNNRVTEEIEMPINETHGYLFITTDRPAYRPTENVEIVLASTDQSMLVEERPRAVKFLIKTPQEFGKVVVEDKMKQVRDGFAEHSYRIPEDPITGVWWAEAEVDGEVMASTSFLIDRYVTPTFDVKIILDQHFILPTQEFITGHILANYSYGETVDGSYFLSFTLVREDGSEEEFYKKPATYQQTASIVNGRERFHVNVDKVEEILRDGESLQTLVETGAKVVIMASVTGLTESVFESDVIDNIIFSNSPYEIDYSRSARFFLPGRIYELKVTIRDVVSDKPLRRVRTTVNWRGDSLTLTSDDHGNIYHEIDNFMDDEEQITITTANEDLQGAAQSMVEFTVLKYANDRQLGMRINKQVANVGDQVFIALDLVEAAPPDIRYYVVSRGEFVHSGTKVLEARQLREVSIPIRVTVDMVPNARVIAYYVLGNTVTANSLWFDVINECKQEITITPEHAQVSPGDAISFRITGPAGGKVNFKAVDRAAYFVHNDTRLTRDTLWTKMEEYDTGCSRKGGRDPVNVFEEAGLSINSAITPKRIYRNMHCTHARRRRRNIAPVPPPASDRLDIRIKKCKTDGERENFYGLSCAERASEAVKIARQKSEDDEYITRCNDAFLSSCRIIEWNGESSLAGRAVGAQDNAQRLRAQPRKDFQENWLSTTRLFNREGIATIAAKAQDSITIYELDAIGMSSALPICIAKTEEVKVFTNFFIQLYLPYSVRVREQANIRFSLFNYGERVERVTVFIRHSDALCSGFLSEDFRELAELEVEPRSSTASYFTILPMKVPDGKTATIEMKAGEADWIKKELLIEEPGQHNESSRSFVLETNAEDPDDIKTFNFQFDIPRKGVMLTTRKCFIYAYAHPMGPSVEIDPFDDKLGNLQNLIHVPAGCGEQNMIRVGPIVYVHMYRITAKRDQVTEAQKRQAIADIQKAYAIELKWRSDRTGDQAFSVWNSHPASTWLNAFVTKVFAAGKKFWEGMDVAPLCTALGWLLGKQNIDGSYRDDYKVHHREMIGQVTDTITLTAYVAISLVETQWICPGRATRLQVSAEEATEFLKANLDQAAGTPYALAMGAYALSLTDPDDIAAADWNQRLRDSKEHDGEYIFWRGTRGRAANIETTAYALLAELSLHGINEHNDEYTRNIAHWLISQRNDKGGFRSTQDTVVALQALSNYMTVLETSQGFAPPPTNIEATFSCESEECEWNRNPEHLTLEVDDTFKRKELAVPSSVIGMGKVTVVVHGVGVGSMAYRCTWRQFAEAGDCHFEVRVEMIDDEEEDNVKILKVTVTKVIGPPAQISIIDVGLLSGYTVKEDTVRDLCNDEGPVDGPADRYEITSNTVKFYLSSLDSDGKKLAFKVRKVCDVENMQPASVSAYDYYEPDIRCTKFYSESGHHAIRTSCVQEPGEAGEEICRCSEGDCPICRTREQQLTDTVCSNHPEHRRLCSRICKTDRSDCFNLHSRTCNKDYLYAVLIEDVRESATPGFKSFTATVQEVFRKTASHQNALGSTVEFQMRHDCFAKCEDPRFITIAEKQSQKAGHPIEPKHFISQGRYILVHGKEPSIDEADDGEKRYIYHIDEDAGLEVLVSPDKCAPAPVLRECQPGNVKCERKNSKARETVSLCEMKSGLKAAHNIGCD